MQNQDIYTVSRLNSEVRLTLELQFQTLWLQGEISNFVAAASGHWYFSLKDNAAQVKCAMFKQANRNSSFKPQNGQQVLIRARISVYEPRGEYQLLAEFIEHAGAGLLKQQFEQLKAKLYAEGLFDEAYKKPIPLHVKRVGVITSPTGAAVRDIITVLQRRSPSTEVIIYPAMVQGDLAANQLRAMLSRAIIRNEVDVLIIGRGGGSFEDLHCFNDELLCRAIAACPIPIVSAVGHEIDFALSDFVADVRAPTPSAAAELVSTDQSHVLDKILRLKAALIQAQKNKLKEHAPKLIHLSQRLSALHPKRRLEQQNQRLDELQLRLNVAVNRYIQNTKQKQQFADRSLKQLPLLKTLQQQNQHISYLEKRMQNSILANLKDNKHRFLSLTAQLHTVSPLATLARGYSITFDTNQQVVTSSKEVKTGDVIKVALSSGSLEANVTKTLD